MDTTPKKELFALLVGIDRYKHLEKHRLYGCKRDVQEWVKYLAEPFVQEQFAAVHIKELPDKDATKENIIQQFREHLSQAKAGDSVLFYFSGHGVREETTVPAFQQSEIDGKISTLVCYDSAKTSPDGASRTFLADKELRWLIAEVAGTGDGPHVVTIFDCCHSGQNTRAATTETFPDNVRQIDRRAIGERKWKGFIFHDHPQLTPEALQQAPLYKLMPEGQHVQLAACREVELSFEEPYNSTSRNGVFTTALLDVLRRHEGRISYRELQSRVVNQMRQRGEMAQTPQIYVRTANPLDRYTTFLTNSKETRPAYCAVVYNKSEREWCINLGAIHGIALDQTAQPTEVSVYTVGQPEKRFPAQVLRVLPGYSVIQFDAPKPTTGNVIYRAEIKGLAIAPLKVHLADGAEIFYDELQAYLRPDKPAYFELEKEESNTDYTLRLRDKNVLLTEPSDKRPLVKPIRVLDDAGKVMEDKLDIVYTDLQQIAQWQFLRELNYRQAELIDLPHYPVELRLYQVDANGQERLMPFVNGHVDLEPTHQLGTHDPITKVTYELINHSDQELCCALLYLTKTFGVSVQSDDVIWLGKESADNSDKKQSYKFVFERDISDPYETYFLEPYIIKDNWIGTEETLKLIVSRTVFDPGDLTMESLPSPEETTKSTRSGTSRGPVAVSLPQVEWDVKTYTISLINPLYQPPKAN